MDRLSFYSGRLALSVGSVLFVAVLLELLFRFLPVSMSLRPLPMNADNPVRRFEPDRTVSFSQFPDFAMRRSMEVNNYGFVNDIEYIPADRTPLAAVIGDSYVEAKPVAAPDTIHGRLRTLQNRYRVYSFGSSSTPLSGYIGYARWVRATFRPQKVIVVIVGNDFDESFRKYRRPGTRDLFDSFEVDRNGELQWFPGSFEPTGAQRILQRSHLAMYLYNNLQLQNLLPRIARMINRSEDRYAGNARALATADRLSDSKRAVDAFLGLLPGAAGLPPSALLLVVDAPRPEMYSEDELAGAADSYFVRMRRYLLEEAESQGIPAIDMLEPMMRDWEKNQERFEFPRDSHWNSRGHKIAARAVMESDFLGQAHAAR